jgi:uncharacterized protein YukJ
MPIANYGVLRARPVDRRLGAGNNPHYQIRCVAPRPAAAGGGVEDFRIAVNVKSRQSPSELLYIVIERFEHSVTDFLETLAQGRHELARQPGAGGLDFIRGNLFDPMEMVALPHDVPGPDNDLNEKFDAIVQRALADESAEVFAYGAAWGPEANRPDNYFGFSPGRGVHEIHLNQGNSGGFVGADGVWQDGGLIFRFPEQDQWVAVFTAFQSQAWHTDDATGHALPGTPPQPGEDPRPNHPTEDHLPTADLPDGLVRIAGALVNTVSSPEREVVTLFNHSNREIDLAQWKLADKQKAKMGLSGKLAAGGTVQVVVQAPMALSNKGGIITLLDPSGRKVHGVSYTKKQAQNVGWTIPF